MVEKEPNITTTQILQRADEAIVHPLPGDATPVFDALAAFGPNFMPEGREDQPPQARPQN